MSPIADLANHRGRVPRAAIAAWIFLATFSTASTGVCRFGPRPSCSRRSMRPITFACASTLRRRASRPRRVSACIPRLRTHAMSASSGGVWGRLPISTAAACGASTMIRSAVACTESRSSPWATGMRRRTRRTPCDAVRATARVTESRTCCCSRAITRGRSSSLIRCMLRDAQTSARPGQDDRSRAARGSMRAPDAS